jgi:hypothetical protein
MQVQQCMVSNMSDEIYQRIERLGNRTIFADEFMREAGKVLQGEGPYVHLRRVAAFDAHRREDFDTTKDLVQAYREQFNQTYELGPRLEPYYAILHMINQLDEAGDCELITNNVMNDLDTMNSCKSVLEKFTVQNFNRLCASIILQCERSDRQRGTRHHKPHDSHVPLARAIEQDDFCVSHDHPKLLREE